MVAGYFPVLVENSLPNINLLTAMELYPFIFEPIYVESPWGGGLLSETLARQPAATATPIGESLELIDSEAAQSVIANGALAGRSLGDIVQAMPASLVSARHDGSTPFPLRVKYIDAGRRLPLQVHPDNHMCAEIPSAEPNTKMWYIVGTRKAARILAGIQFRCTQQQFLGRIGTPEIEDMIVAFPAEPGDAYYIVAGRPCAIDAGNLVLSIQQNSDSAYVLTDWGNADVPTDPEERQTALRCIHFEDRTVARIRGESSVVLRNRKVPLITTCPYFAVDELRLVNEMYDRTDGSSFHLVTAIDGDVAITSTSVEVYLERGRSALVPAAFGSYATTPADGLTKVLKASLNTS